MLSKTKCDPPVPGGSSTIIAIDEDACNPSLTLDEDRRPDPVLMTLLILACLIEGLDQALLPVTFYAMAHDLNLELKDLAILSTAEAIPSAIGAIIWGILADRGVLTRRSLLVIGSTGWGVATAVSALVPVWQLMILTRAMNGLMLACLRPICNGIVADVTSENSRGMIFGRLQVALFAGNMISSLAVTPVSSLSLWGIQGWRAAFLTVAALSILFAVMVRFLMVEPERERNPESQEFSESTCSPVPNTISHCLKEELCRIVSYLKIPTFDILILQGIFGTIACNAFVYSTLFFQTAGLGNAKAGIISSVSQAAGGAGSLLGGVIADSLTRRVSRYHGRPLAAQISIACAMILNFILYVVLSPLPSNFPYYIVLAIGLGLTATWCYGGTVCPVLSEIVEPEGRSTIMAWDAVLEGASGAIFGNLGVSLFSSLLGFDIHDNQSQDASALGKAIALTAILPWAICFMFFSMLHWSYPQDGQRIAQRRNAANPSFTWPQKLSPVLEEDPNPDVIFPPLQGDVNPDHTYPTTQV